MRLRFQFHVDTTSVRCCCLVVVLQLLVHSNSPAQDRPKVNDARERVSERLVVAADTQLDPAKIYSGIVVSASNVTIDGNGAVIEGSLGGNPKRFQGVGIRAKGVSNVVLRNVRVRGFETALHVSDGEKWRVEECDFSDNFHDPEFGWGENGRRGGILFERVNDSVLRKNVAHRVWDACSLVLSNRNLVEQNDFSFTSNTCLKLWISSNNTIKHNSLTHGIRIAPKEVHARDSTCVLIESGSNENQFIGNNCTFGGDGIFVRVLNGWCSTGNLFDGNDCSYANNNGFECWAPQNTFVRNRANHCSYGFWMGGSDGSRLEDNEASFNGRVDGNHNSPHLPDQGHAGIVFMFGPSSHTVVRRNRCEGNNGAGIAAIGDLQSKGEKWKAQHWIIEENELLENRWGVYIRCADWIRIAANRFRGNQKEEVRNDGFSSRIEHLTTRRQSETDHTDHSPPVALLEGPTSSTVGREVVFRGGARGTEAADVKFGWNLGDGTVNDSPSVKHTFKSPGFFRVGLTVVDGGLADLAYRDFYVVSDQPESGTEKNSVEWTFEKRDSLHVSFVDDASLAIAGGYSVRATFDPYHGERARITYPASKKLNRTIRPKTTIGFWLKVVNPNLPGWQFGNPEITLHEDAEKYLRLTPEPDLLSQPSYNEARIGWRYFSVPLDTDSRWKREGTEIHTLNYLTFGFDSWDSQPFTVWVDGLVLP